MMKSAANQQLGVENWFLRLMAILVGLLVLRLGSLWFNNSELFFDEAQYWAWAQQIEFGYFSKPPMLAWIIAASTGLCGSDSEFCVRLPAPLIHFAVAVAIYFTAKKLFDARTGFWAGMLYSLMPAVSLSSTIISTDVPLLFFWSMALLAFLHLETENTVRWAIVLGVALGFGMLSKYAMAYFFVCCVVYFLLVKPDNPIWRSGKFWLSLGIAALIFSGNIIWNLQNQFTTVTHTGENINWTGVNLHILKALEFLGSQFGVFGPITMGIFLIALVRLRGFSGSREQNFLVAFSAPILLIIIFQALMSKAYANWAALTYIAAMIFVADIMLRLVPKGWMNATLWIHGVLFVVLSMAVTRAGPGQLVLPGGNEPFKRTQGSTEMAMVIVDALDKGQYGAVITTDRRTSSLMTYKLRQRREPVLAWRETAVPDDYFEQKRAYQDQPTDTALVVYAKSGIRNIREKFDKVEKLGEYLLSSGEQNRVVLYSVSGYKGKAAK